MFLHICKHNIFLNMEIKLLTLSLLVTIFCLLSCWTFLKKCKSRCVINIRIHHECEGRIEKSVPSITNWHHKAYRVMTNGDREGCACINNSHFNLSWSKAKQINCPPRGGQWLSSLIQTSGHTIEACHCRSSHYAVAHVHNKDSNIQGRSPNVVKVIFYTKRNCS